MVRQFINKKKSLGTYFSQILTTQLKSRKMIVVLLELNVILNMLIIKCILQEVNSGKYDGAFYDYLTNFDLNNFNFINMSPKTNFNNEMRDLDTTFLER